MKPTRAQAMQIAQESVALARLRQDGLTPDDSGMFVVPDGIALSSGALLALSYLCDVGDYDWKLSSEAAV